MKTVPWPQVATSSLHFLCLFSPPVLVRCSNLLCYFCLDSLPCSETAWHVHKHKPPFKVNRRIRSETTWWHRTLGKWPRPRGPGRSPMCNERVKNQSGNQSELREKRWTWLWLPPSFLKTAQKNHKQAFGLVQHGPGLFDKSKARRGYCHNEDKQETLQVGTAFRILTEQTNRKNTCWGIRKAFCIRTEQRW